jgi:hypothetical protein
MNTNEPERLDVSNLRLEMVQEIARLRKALVEIAHTPNPVQNGAAAWAITTARRALEEGVLSVVSPGIRAHLDHAIERMFVGDDVGVHEELHSIHELLRAAET